MAPGELERLQAKIVRLHGLIETAALITSSLQLEDVLRLVLERAQEVASAEASSILLYNPATRRLEFEVALGEKGRLIQSLRKQITFALGQGIVGMVAQTREPIWVADAASDPRVAKQVDANTGFTTPPASDWLRCAPCSRTPPRPTRHWSSPARTVQPTCPWPVSPTRWPEPAAAR